LYLVIRCGGCKSFTYVDKFQQWKLCPICGATIEVMRAPRYLEVEDFRVAESIVDLTAEEREQLRATYAEWIRNQT
jgi:acetyl-CoA carboxylase beta subunit